MIIANCFKDLKDEYQNDQDMYNKDAITSYYFTNQTFNKLNLYKGCCNPDQTKKIYFLDEQTNYPIEIIDLKYRNNNKDDSLKTGLLNIICNYFNYIQDELNSYETCINLTKDNQKDIYNNLKFLEQAKTIQTLNNSKEFEPNQKQKEFLEKKLIQTLTKFLGKYYKLNLKLDEDEKNSLKIPKITIDELNDMINLYYDLHNDKIKFIEFY